MSALVFAHKPFRIVHQAMAATTAAVPPLDEIESNKSALKFIYVICVPFKRTTIKTIRKSLVFYIHHKIFNKNKAKPKPQ